MKKRSKITKKKETENKKRAQNVFDFGDFCCGARERKEKIFLNGFGGKSNTTCQKSKVSSSRFEELSLNLTVVSSPARSVLQGNCRVYKNTPCKHVQKRSHKTRTRSSHTGRHRRETTSFYLRCPFSLSLFPENMWVLLLSLLPPLPL